MITKKFVLKKHVSNSSGSGRCGSSSGSSRGGRGSVGIVNVGGVGGQRTSSNKMLQNIFTQKPFIALGKVAACIENPLFIETQEVNCFDLLPVQLLF